MERRLHTCSLLSMWWKSSDEKIRIWVEIWHAGYWTYYNYCPFLLHHLNIIKQHYNISRPQGYIMNENAIQIFAQV